VHTPHRLGVPDASASSSDLTYVTFAITNTVATAASRSAAALVSARPSFVADGSSGFAALYTSELKPPAHETGIDHSGLAAPDLSDNALGRSQNAKNTNRNEADSGDANLKNADGDRKGSGKKNQDIQADLPDTSQPATPEKNPVAPSQTARIIVPLAALPQPFDARRFENGGSSNEAGNVSDPAEESSAAMPIVQSYRQFSNRPFRMPGGSLPGSPSSAKTAFALSGVLSGPRGDIASVVSSPQLLQNASPPTANVPAAQGPVAGSFLPANELYESAPATSGGRDASSFPAGASTLTSRVSAPLLDTSQVVEGQRAETASLSRNVAAVRNVEDASVEDGNFDRETTSSSGIGPDEQTSQNPVAGAFESAKTLSVVSVSDGDSENVMPAESASVASIALEPDGPALSASTAPDAVPDSSQRALKVGSADTPAQTNADQPDLDLHDLGLQDLGRRDVDLREFNARDWNSRGLASQSPVRNSDRHSSDLRADLSPSTSQGAASSTAFPSNGRLVEQPGRNDTTDSSQSKNSGVSASQPGTGSEASAPSMPALAPAGTVQTPSPLVVPSPFSLAVSGAAAAASDSGHSVSPQAARAEAASPPDVALNSPPVVPAQPAGPVQMAQMVSQAAQSEMRIGLTTSAFGSVEVHTVVHANDVGVLIGSEKGDLRSLFTSELPGIANTLQQQNLRLNHVDFHQGFSFSNQTPTGGGSQSRTFEGKSTGPLKRMVEIVGADSAEGFEDASYGTRARVHSCPGGGLNILA
jgi:hypothetical protein